jgi:Zn-dependent peptidase ImmA (M78 family)
MESDKSKIEQICTLLICAYDDKEIRVNLKKILDHLGYKVKTIDSNKFKNETIKLGEISSWLDRSKKEIGVSSCENRNSQIFNIAHQLGHTMLHNKTVKHGIEIEFSEEKHKNFREKSAKEKEADYFASCLLMPEEEFKYQYKKLNGNLMKLSKLFDVSFVSATIRVDYLGLLIDS